MKTSTKGLALIKEFEGCKLAAYLCPAGVLTVGYGHTRGVKKGDVITQATADRLLVDDVAAFESEVSRLAKVTLTQGQFDALVSFAYNLGSKALEGSTLLKKFNAGDKSGAADEFGKWVNANGVKLAGLVKRRAAERELFVS